MPPLRRRLDFWLTGRLGAMLLMALHDTWRVVELDRAGAARQMRQGSAQGIVAFWHRHVVTMLTHHSGAHVVVPVSRSRDGEYIAHVMDRMGLASVRGSTSRGGLAVLRDMLAAAGQGFSVAVTPDGPRGPRFSVQPGVALLARRSGLPVYPFGIAARDAWVFNSWDRFVLAFGTVPVITRYQANLPASRLPAGIILNALRTSNSPAAEKFCSLYFNPICCHLCLPSVW